MNAIACALTATASGLISFAFWRFFVGLGIGAISTSLTALSAELSPPSQRGLFITAVSSFWSFGTIYASCTAFGVMGLSGLSWRIFMFVTALPSMVSVVLVAMTVPDSPRYLAMHGRYQDAADVANWVALRLGHQGERLTVEEVHYHFSRERSSKEENETKESDEGFSDEPHHVASCRRSNVMMSVSEAARNISALYSKFLWNRTVSLQLLWIFLEMGTGLGSFLNVIYEEIGAGAYLGSTLSAVGNVIGSVLGAIFLDRMGRKSSISVTMVIASLTSLVYAWVLSGEMHPLPPLMFCTFLFSCLTTITWNANMTLTSEMFPTKVRAIGLGFIAATGRIASIGQQFINGAFVERPEVLLTIAGALLILGSLTMLFLKTGDMAQKPLSDSIGSNQTNEKEYTMVSLETDGIKCRNKTDTSDRLPAVV